MTIARALKSSLIGAVSLAAISHGAFAADAVVEEPVTGYNWSGLYVGAGAGVGAVRRVLSFGDFQIMPDQGGHGVFGEVTLGYDYMLSQRFLLGGFADVRFGNIGFSAEIEGQELLSITNDYGFDVGARAGYLLTPSTLGYVLAGYTWQHFDVDVADLPPGISLDTDRDGYILGAGLETAVAANWTLKGEYRYADYGKHLVEFLDINSETSTHTFHVGVNYRPGAQNGGGASFAAPAYNWTGFYVGGALGAGAIADTIKLGGGVFELNGFGGEGIFGELSVGYDHEINDLWVVGLQLDGRYSGMTTVLFEAGPNSYEATADYGFDILARVGAKVNESTLAYAIGGYSWQHVKEEVTGGPAPNDDWSVNGFSVGGGLEAAVSSNVTANIEYRYSRFEGQDYDSGGVWETIPVFHTVRIGAKYKFN
ncbi:MAG: outer membrane beta-barrel protein [Pseudomonadota bacterium]|nr:outer membrane beta-barrel protein [Pseudomonadota bacterium]